MRWLRWAALAVGAWTALSGLAHEIGVWNTARLEAKPYDFRYASLLALGWALMAAGALQAWGARELARDPARGRALAGGASVFVIVLVAIYAPVLPSWGLLGLQVALLAGLIAGAARSRSR